MRAAWLALALAGCAAEEVAPPALSPGVRTWIDGAGPSGGAVVVQVVAPAEVRVDVGAPAAPGLEWAPDGAPRVERAGELQVITARWTYRGPKGHYEVSGPDAAWAGGAPLRPSPLFVDVGVEPPREGELADIEEPAAVWAFPWMAAAGGAGLLALLGGGVWLAFRPGPPAPPPPLDPPDVRALRAWEAARRDPALDDHARALAISRIFREYTEEVLAFPATSWTTSEILTHLAGLARLAEANGPRARRLLRATDRVKYAEAGTTAELFEQLDGDLRAFVDSTRPRALARVEG